MQSLLELTELSVFALSMGVAITTLAALIHGTLGFGFGLVSVSVLVLVDANLAPAPQLVMTFPMAVFLAWRERSAAHWPGVRLVLLGAVPGTVLGALLLRAADKQLLDLVIGGVVLVAVFVLARGAAVRRNRVTLVLAGLATGVMSLVSAIGGPPLALVYRDASGATLRSTVSVVFGAGIFFALAARAWAGGLVVADGWRGLAMAPGLALGLWGSRFLIARVEGPPLRVAVLVVAAVAGLVLMGRALAG